LGQLIWQEAKKNKKNKKKKELSSHLGQPK
jgi:hypothetical protein